MKLLVWRRSIVCVVLGREINIANLVVVHYNKSYTLMHLLRGCASVFETMEMSASAAGETRWARLARARAQLQRQCRAKYNVSKRIEVALIHELVAVINLIDSTAFIGDNLDIESLSIVASNPFVNCSPVCDIRFASRYRVGVDARCKQQVYNVSVCTKLGKKYSVRRYVFIGVEREKRARRIPKK